MENNKLFVTAIIAAAGKSERAQLKQNKVLHVSDGTTVLEKTLAPFDNSERINRIIIASSRADFDIVSELAKNLKTPNKVVFGGDTRTFTIANALESCDGDIVIIHDGARPYISEKLIDDCLDAAALYGSGISAIPCTDTIGETDGETIFRTHRTDSCLIQTPQAFLLSEIKHAYSFVTQDDAFTDDAGVYCKYVKPVHLVKGLRNNVKLTYYEDFIKHEQLCGTGFDLHRLTENRRLILGGILIPYEKGLLGHSDADVVIHALMDALLSAVGLKDIGTYFSDKDDKYKDIDSMILLRKVLEMLAITGFKPKNVSLAILAEKPKLYPYTDKMRERIAEELSIEKERVGITCTTLEGIGIVGREEGIACQAYVSVESILQPNK